MISSEAICLTWPPEPEATEIQRNLAERLPPELARKINSFVSRQDAFRYGLGAVEFNRVSYLVTVAKSHAGAKLILEFIPSYNESVAAENEKLRFFENILKEIPTQIAVFDSTKRYRYVNDAGIANPEIRNWIIGKTDAEYCAYRNKPLYLAEERNSYADQCLASGKEISWHEEISDGPGLTRTFLRRYHPVLNEKGQVDFMIGYGMDISDLRMLQDKLDKSKDNYKNLIENSSDIFYTTDKTGQFTFCNSVSETITGYKKSEITGKNYLDLIREDYREIVALHYAEQIDAKTLRSYLEFPITTAEGTIVWLGQNVQLLYNAAGEFTGCEAIARNISEQQILKEQLLAIITSLDDIVMQVNDEYRFVGVWTRETSSLFLPPEQFIDKTFREVLGDYAGMFEKTVDSTLKTGQSQIIEYRQPGTDRWFSAKFSPMKPGMGRGRNISVLIRDITEAHRSAEVIEQNSVNLAALIDNTEDRIWSIDKSFRLLSCNTSFLIHMKKKWDWDPKIGDQLPFDKFDRETSEFWLKSLTSCFDGEAFVTERVRVSELEIRNDEYSFNPIRDKNDTVVGAAIFGRNITARKEAEQELQEARRIAEESNKIRQQFIANMSHEIRTPINAIIGSTHLLLEESLTEKQKYYVNTVTESSRFLLSMINDVLDLSKIDSGKLELDQSTFSLTDLIRSLELTTTGLAQQKGLTFNCYLDSEPPDEYIVSDKARLLQVLVNLTGNAIKFTDSGSVNVTVSVTRKSGSVRILHVDVVDTGIGIAAEQQQNIFKPFGQANSSISSKYGGTGLGLNISQKIIKALGGEIKVKSRPKSGSQFYFSIPVVVSARKKEPSVVVGESPQKFTGRILIVEDHDFNRLFLKKLLTAYGFEVDEASNGEDAYKLVCSSDPYDLILLDLRMPRWDGYKTLEMIRSCSNGKNVQVWAHTADVMSDEKEKATRAGFTNFLPKPLDQEKLKIMISDLQTRKPVMETATPDINLELLRKTFQDPVVFNEIIDNLEESLKQNAGQLEEMIAADNFDQLRDLIHKMRPSASLVKMESVLKLFTRDLSENGNINLRRDTAIALRQMIVANLSVMRERV
ncbi:MAG: hypothetical protein RL007_1290 [Bacteroidota bacterium]|jgi:PAS domain S-box-containing protein